MPSCSSHSAGRRGLPTSGRFSRTCCAAAASVPERIEEVAHHYERFGGVSPLTELTMQQARALEAALRARGLPLPVHVGMRNWHPYLADTLGEMSRAGVRRAIGVLAAAQRSYSGCLQYRENVRDARAAVSAETGSVAGDRLRRRLARASRVSSRPTPITSARRSIACPPIAAPRARLVFTAHSIPVSMAEQLSLRSATARLGASCIAAGGGPRRLDARLSEPQRPSGGSLARARRLRLPARGTRRTGSTPSSSARSASSAITSRCSTISTSRPPRPAGKPASRWSAPRR